jgi:hypothetical protein
MKNMYFNLQMVSDNTDKSIIDMEMFLQSRDKPCVGMLHLNRL